MWQTGVQAVSYNCKLTLQNVARTNKCIENKYTGCLCNIYKRIIGLFIIIAVQFSKLNPRIYLRSVYAEC